MVRDLHDGAQQRLVHTIITLKLARRALQDEEDDAPALVTEALDHAERATVELRELAHGILPAVLTRGGLRAGVEALASRMPVPVEIDVSVGRLPAAVEATAYFVVAEALTNVAKHARAGHAAVTARVEDGTLAGPGARRRRRRRPARRERSRWGWRTGSPPSTAGSGSRARPTAARSSPQTSPSAASARSASGRFTRFRGAACGNRAECGNVSAAELIPRGNDAVRPALGWMPAPGAGGLVGDELAKSAAGARSPTVRSACRRSNPKATLEGGWPDGMCEDGHGAGFTDRAGLLREIANPQLES